MPRCDFCRLLTLDKLAGLVNIKPDLASLKRSADAGCDFCLLCWKGFERQWLPADIDSVLSGGVPQGFPDFDEGIWLWGHVHQHGNATQPEIKVCCGEVGFGTGQSVKNMGLGEFQLDVYAKDDSPEAQSILGRLCTKDNEPGLYIPLIQRWLQQCSKFHGKRCVSEEVGAMPTRVIQVGDPDKGETPRLVLPGPDMREVYLALSYCWGTGAAPFTLNGSTIEEMFSGIDESILATAHRDTFQIARSLGIRFVWIDALCIIQGNLEDWEHESRLMAEVYSKAALTVIAGRSDDARNSFVINDLQPPAPPCEIRVDESSTASVFVGLRRSRMLGPVDSRGWCLQEKLLSRRMIIFGRDQLKFKCQSCSVYEDGSTETLRADVDLHSLFIAPSPNLEAKRDRLLTKWDSILVDFSKRRLSNPHDIFAAIASIAAPMSKAIESRYLAGLWDCDMVRGLLWKPGYQLNAKFRTEPTTRPASTRLAPGPVIRAPSWSWAAIQGPVLHMGRSEWRRKKAKYQGSHFIKVSPKLRNPDRWTADVDCGVQALHMPSCELQLRGRVAHADVLPGAAFGYLKSHGFLDINQGFFWTFSAGLLLRRDDISRVSLDQDDAGVGAVGLFDLPDEGSNQIWCLQVVSNQGLMLRQSEDGKFQRAGWFALLEDDWFDNVEEVELSLV
ncbi:hypothetical protein FZEAL_3453 [Fusarium zealandicum]|uniref:Heterokaryon incompatibility domain-containing protein n=1 Tax=Fusarium zealandicum TaxID=1053134 RepID=A0A8H4UPH6_9HYPO|nr:hypothetical protein FZEAL_3453 [Fusarium zealandicum]